LTYVLISNSTGLCQVPQEENLQMQEYDAEVDLVQTGDKVNKSDIVTKTNVKAPECNQFAYFNSMPQEEKDTTA
jgi:hypothetical protein